MIVRGEVYGELAEPTLTLGTFKMTEQRKPGYAWMDQNQYDHTMNLQNIYWKAASANYDETFEQTATFIRDIKKDFPQEGFSPANYILYHVIFASSPPAELRQLDIEGRFERFIKSIPQHNQKITQK